MARLRLAALVALLLGAAATYLVSGDAPPSPDPLPAMVVSLSEAPRVEQQATPPRARPSPTLAASGIDEAQDGAALQRLGTDGPRVSAPMVPTPLWLDAPYAALALDPRAQVVQGEAPLPPLLDRTSFDVLMLDSLISMRRMRSGLQHAMGGSHRFRVPADTRAEVEAPYLMPTLDVLAERARVASRLTTRHAGGLHLTRGDTVQGRGTLLIEGDLHVPEGASLYWDGLVLLHTDRAPHQLRADLLGDVQIRGAMAMRQTITDTLAWQATLSHDMTTGLYVSLGNEARLYYDSQSLRMALDAVLPVPG
ncbi:MAG: hypothetical protein AAF089_05390 [Bacteroidota bacterium]